MGKVNVLLVVHGDAAYLLLPWLMKPYVDNVNTTAKKKLFNYIEQSKSGGGNAFGCLKGHYECSLKQIGFNLKNVPAVVVSCMVLHSLCEQFGDKLCDKWLSMDSSQCIMPSFITGADTVRSPQAATSRDAVKNYLK